MFSEEDLSGGDKVCTAVPYIYIYIYIYVRVGLFSKIEKIENLAMLDRILPHDIFYAMSSFHHDKPPSPLN